MNFNHSTKWCLRKEFNLFQENVNKSFDSHGRLSIDLDLKSISYEMLKGTSPNFIQNNQVIREKYFENLILMIFIS